jgi:plasmid maintenance system antidote protein VapI
MTAFANLMDEHGVSQHDLVVSLAVTPKAVRNWRDGSRQPTPDNARIIEARFGIPKHLIRPDIWDPPPPPKPSRKRTADAST